MWLEYKLYVGPDRRLNSTERQVPYYVCLDDPHKDM